MTLNFHKRGSNSERGEHYGAIAGAWPNHRRFIIEKAGRDWRLSAYKHVPGVGFEFYLSQYEPTLKAAKARAEEMANPQPVDRSSSSYTDA